MIKLIAIFCSAPSPSTMIGTEESAACTLGAALVLAASSSAVGDAEAGASLGAFVASLFLTSACTGVFQTVGRPPYGLVFALVHAAHFIVFLLKF